MSLRIEIKGKEKEVIAREIGKELKKKYGENLGEIRFYPTGSFELAKLGLGLVQTILTFVNEEDPEYPLLKGLEAGLSEYIKYSRKKE